MLGLENIIALLAETLKVWAGESCNNDNSENVSALLNHEYILILAYCLMSCYMSCPIQVASQRLNYSLAVWTFELNDNAGYFLLKSLLWRNIRKCRESWLRYVQVVSNGTGVKCGIFFVSCVLFRQIL